MKITDIGVNGAGVGDGAFHGEIMVEMMILILDWGTNNDDHDGFDLDGDGFVDSTESSEISEPLVTGFDGVEDTFDEGEDRVVWLSYDWMNQLLKLMKMGTQKYR